MTSTMLAIDTSALMAIIFGEADAERLAGVLVRHAGMCTIGAPTLVEAGIVAEGRAGPNGAQLLNATLERVSASVTPFDAALARGAVEAWRRFGKGRHPAQLNMGDCFAYAVARRLDAPLLFKGDDFTQTDVRSAV